MTKLSKGKRQNVTLYFVNVLRILPSRHRNRILKHIPMQDFRLILEQYKKLFDIKEDQSLFEDVYLLLKKVVFISLCQNARQKKIKAATNQQ